MIGEDELRRLNEKIAKLEAVFVEIRDHPDTPRTVQGIADFGEGRVEDLKVYVSQLFTKP